MSAADRVLIIDADAEAVALLAAALDEVGMHTEVVGEVSSVMQRLGDFDPDVVLLDLDLPDASGFDVLREVRSARQVPVIIVTARSGEGDKVLAFELGADDFVIKPFSPREVTARIGAVNRRYAASQEMMSTVAAGPVRVDVDRHRVTVDGTPIRLRLKEFTLLEFLVRNRNRVLTRGQLTERVWGEHFDGDPKRLDTIVKHLRRRIEPDPAAPRHLLTVRSVGYRFEG